MLALDDNATMSNLTATITAGHTYRIVVDRWEDAPDQGVLTVWVGGASHVFTNDPPGEARLTSTGTVVAVSSVRPSLIQESAAIGQPIYSIVFTDIMSSYLSIRGTTE